MSGRTDGKVIIYTDRDVNTRNIAHGIWQNMPVRRGLSRTIRTARAFVPLLGALFFDAREVQRRKVDLTTIRRVHYRWTILPDLKLIIFFEIHSIRALISILDNFAKRIEYFLCMYLLNCRKMSLTNNCSSKLMWNTYSEYNYHVTFFKLSSNVA